MAEEEGRGVVKGKEGRAIWACVVSLPFYLSLSPPPLVGRCLLLMSTQCTGVNNRVYLHHLPPLPLSSCFCWPGYFVILRTKYSFRLDDTNKS